MIPRVRCTSHISALKTCGVFTYIPIRFSSTTQKKTRSISIDELPSITSARKGDSARCQAGSIPSVTKIRQESHDVQSLVEYSGDRGVKGAGASLFKTIRSLMDRYKNHVVFVQVGGFYELYFEHAEKYAPKIDIKVAQRSYKSFGRVPFAGFPVASLDKYLKILVNDLGYSVAIADQFMTETSGELPTGRISRRVARIVTPGTLIDESLRNFQQNNFLLSISFPEDPCKTVANPDMKIGLAWSDVALGNFYTQETNLQNLITNVSRIRPSEILLNEKLASEELESGRWYPELAELKRYYVRYQNLPSKLTSVKGFYGMFNDEDAALNRCFQDLSQKEISAAISVLLYISENLPESELNFALPERQIASTTMQIDSRTSDALELHKTFRDDKTAGSLIFSIRRTVTPSGTRLLSSWISAPSTSVSEIRRRQKLVDLFRKRGGFSNAVTHQLKLSADISRIVQRLSLGKIDAFELCSLSKTLYIVNDLKSQFEKVASETKAAGAILAPVISSLNSPVAIADEISSVIDEDALIRNMRTKEVERAKLNSMEDDFEDDANDDHALNVEDWIVRKESNNVLRKCHDEYEELLDRKRALLDYFNRTFVEANNCRNVALQLHKVYGFVVCVTGSAKNLSALSELPPGLNILHSTKQSRLFYSRDWKHIGTDIRSHVERIRTEENRIIFALRRKILSRTQEIRAVARCLDYIDVLNSFSVLALEKNLTAPKVTSSTELKIIGGRHIVVEDGLKSTSRQFTPNDCTLDSKDDQKSLWIVSGPNMGGKSTFLRQNAIIVIMAQMGSFVPADEAIIGMVDKVFTRIGSADDLYRELSTFMVEMVETSFILKNATERSLAILDEIGRGTSGKEGLSIAYATLLHLLKYNKSRSLFATHFGTELSNLLHTIGDDQKKIAYYKTSISLPGNTEEFRPDNIMFDHKLKEGVSSKSYAIEVAQLAGFPKHAVNLARQSLARLNFD